MDDGRCFWFFDSWEGVPSPTALDVSTTGISGEAGLFKGSEAIAEGLLFGGFGASRLRTHLVKGWFNQTLPKTSSEIGRIALLHVDCDYYEPVKFCLEVLYPLVSPGGAVVIDDYDDWQGCRLAVDEFLTSQVVKPTATHRLRAGMRIEKPLDARGMNFVIIPRDSEANESATGPS